MRQLGPLFERTCILGYPPFVKGLIDTGNAAGIGWQQLDVCLVLAGEVFSEEWRQLVAQRAGIKVPLRDVVGIYGTADAGVLGTETWYRERERERERGERERGERGEERERERASWRLC